VFRVTNTLNFKNKNVDVYEITFESYKSFLKALFRVGQPDFFIKNVYKFIESSTNASYEFIETLSSIDILIILIEIRCLSLGTNLILNIKNTPDESTENTENTEPTYTTYNRNLYTLQTLLLSLSSHLAKVIHNTTIQLRYPSLHEIKDNAHVYIDSVSVLDNVLNFNTNNKQSLYEHLPIYLIKVLPEYINGIIELFEAIPIVDIEDGTKINFTLTYDFICYFIKLIFGDNLMVLHENLFKLSQFAGIDLNYINNCSPGEALLYMKILDAAIREKNKAQN